MFLDYNLGCYRLPADHPFGRTSLIGARSAGYQSVVEYVDHFAPVRTRGDKSQARALRLLTSEEPAKTKRAAWSALANA